MVIEFAEPKSGMVDISHKQATFAPSSHQIADSPSAT
jgi:hypothetical protein